MNRTFRRLGGAIAAGALTATALSVATAAPAHAATCATSTTLKVYKTKNEFGSYNSVSADVSATSSSCYDPFYGTTRIQRSTNGGKSWSTVETGGASYAYFSGSGKFNKTARYRAVYSGGSSSSTSWTASTSTARTVSVYRKVGVADRSTRRASVAQFTIRPAASIKGMRALFQRKAAGKWRVYKRVRVPGTGKFKVTFANSRKGIRYRMILPSGRGMVKSTHGPFVAKRY
jgi:hypothetical protein